MSHSCAAGSSAHPLHQHCIEHQLTTAVRAKTALRRATPTKAAPRYDSTYDAAVGSTVSLLLVHDAIEGPFKVRHLHTL